jgi:GNAT superfamily N-acetyltransferase
VTVAAGYRLRPPTPSDAAAVAELIRAADPVEPITADDVAHWWRRMDVERDVAIVEDEQDNVVASVEVNKRPGGTVFAEAFVRPEHTGRGLGTELLRFSERRARELLGGGGRLMNGVLASNAGGRTLLKSNGYRLVRHFWRMVIDLDGEPPPPHWPDGLQPRPFRAEDAHRFYETVEDAFADHWEHHRDTFEGWRRSHLDGADTSLWLGMWDGDELAAAMICVPRRYDVGWVDTLGVRPPWRRRGIARALLQHAFLEFWRRGERRVGLGVDAESDTGATQLYESVGMRVLFEIATYEKELG